MLMKLEEFLSNVPKDEIVKRLIFLDKSIMDLHANNFYVVCDLTDIDVIDNEITLASFKNKVDYIKQPSSDSKQDDEGFNPYGARDDIWEMCAIGICAFNKMHKFYSTRDFIYYLVENLDLYLDNGNVPNIMKEYYIDVFLRGNVDYLNNFLLKNYEKEGTSNNKCMVYMKTTAVGKALSEETREAAYAKILLLPAIVCLVFLIVIVIYSIFYR